MEFKDKAIQTIAYAFPFANSLKITNAVASKENINLLVPIIIVLGYTILMIVASLLVFLKKINSDKI